MFKVFVLMWGLGAVVTGFGIEDPLVNPTPQVCGLSVTVSASVQVNDDEDQAPGSPNYDVQDFRHAPSPLDDDLQRVDVRATADKTDAVVVFSVTKGVEFLTCAGDGKVFRKDPEKKEQVAELSWIVPAGTTLVKTLYFEGTRPSEKVDDVGMAATLDAPAGVVDGQAYAACQLHSGVKQLTVYQVDVDVDSLNDNGYAFDGFTGEEDQIEVSESVDAATGDARFGKIVLLSSRKDSDGDRIPDYADGFDLVGYKTGDTWWKDWIEANPKDVGSDLRFVPLQIELKKPFDPSRAKVRIDYVCESRPEISDDGIVVSGEGTKEDPYVYTIAKGGMRIWRKEASKRISGRAVPVGDFIPSDRDVNWSDLVTDGGRIAKLYIEYVDTWPATQQGRKIIKVIVTQGDARAEDSVMVTLLPVEVAELGPKLKDSSGYEIPGTQRPRAFLEPNEMVEEISLKDHRYDLNRIAHREIKLRVHGGDFLRNKKVTWTMAPSGVLPGSSVRGSWSASKVSSYQSRFSASDLYAEYSYERLNQESSTTVLQVVSGDGVTAVRANLPPYGWNHADIFAEIEGVEEVIWVASFVVPAVIVLDPGHGGDVDLDQFDLDHSTGLKVGASAANHAIGGQYIESTSEQRPSGVLEKTLTMAYCRAIETKIVDGDSSGRPINVYLTRNGDKNLGGYERARCARDRGADVMLSLHFNALKPPTKEDIRDAYAKEHGRYPSEDWLNAEYERRWIHSTSVRRPLYVRRENGNVNQGEDDALGAAVVQATHAVLRAFDPSMQERERSPIPGNLAVTSDLMGFFQDEEYHPIRSALLEVEFIHYKGGDLLINGGRADAVKQGVADSLHKCLVDYLNGFEL
ncbi:N-acetylmuramoyl-L-alanine amidase family protein [Sulfuriroseicoccus oceanibius]|uniref:N-acetylmuramoyl-L-alanine amidase n=1 Tax=Sulfuriroseicoccus oceanibius TaxID=2707525 RepID=A0A6B3L0C8_9BACT|nr:N-acetylmuramoyl-L-alanine amidase [Sulfuriroseicoccus oceanibius]QQL43822.1 N-acetylmuramoyl-L-alanine amidase [Sulfuriroseicoccus oceanibius]